MELNIDKVQALYTLTSGIVSNLKTIAADHSDLNELDIKTRNIVRYLDQIEEADIRTVLRNSEDVIDNLNQIREIEAFSFDLNDLTAQTNGIIGNLEVIGQMLEPQPLPAKQPVADFSPDELEEIGMSASSR